MDRRRFIVAVSAAAISAPLAAEAQKRPVTIGVLCAGNTPTCAFPVPPQPSRPLIVALERTGLIPGRTLTWDIGGIVSAEDQVSIAADRLVSRRPHLILVWPGSVAVARAAKAATRTIPIVFMAVSDALEHGLVDSLRRPGGNITGTSVPLFDLTIKQLQVLSEINPRLKRVIVAQGQVESPERRIVQRLRESAASLGLDSDGISVADPEEIEQAVASVQKDTTTILAIGSMPHGGLRRIQVVTLERKVPLIVSWRVWEGGGSTSGTLIAYGPHFPDIAERTANLIDRIVNKGARPADLPVEEPTRYELIIDGVTAKALGLTIPPGVRARADQVIE